MNKNNKKIKKNIKSAGVKQKVNKTESAQNRGEETVGVLQGSGKGFAFLVPTDGSGDLFIAADNLNGAIHGDTVAAVKISQRRGSGEGEVVRIIKRGITCVVGVFDGKYVVSYERGLGSIKIDSHSGLIPRVGDKVAAKIVDGSKPLKCRVTEILGVEGETEADVMGVIRSFDLHETFPKNVMREADSISDFVDESEMKGRRDFRGDTVVTIDGATSKDFDDAICVKPKKNGGYTLYVHIADVAEYVKPQSKLDVEALKRGTSVYFADRVLPMLPEALSNGICSLNEGEDRLTLSCVMEFDENGDMLSHEIVEGIIRSKARMTYESVEKILDGDEEERAKYPEIVPMLTAAEKLAKILNAKRMARGAVEFDIEESEILMNPDGSVRDVVKRKRLFSHKLIEEFMLIANETVAKHFAERKVPFVYRVHETPPLEKVEGLNAFLSPLGLNISDKPTPSDYARLIESLDESVKGAVNRVALRSMSKAAYKPECLGHFGLAAEFYCHFTSPIRRYPDLAVHRIIKYVLRGGKDAEKRFAAFAAEASVKSSEREKIADEAERKVDDLLKAKFMKDKVGNEYDALISGVTDWGLFAELSNSVEGMIRVESLPGGGYEYDEKLLRISNGSRSFRLGDKVRIRVEAVSFDKIAFALVE